jgi:hypothetical protein
MQHLICGDLFLLGARRVPTSSKGAKIISWPSSCRFGPLRVLGNSAPRLNEEPFGMLATSPTRGRLSRRPHHRAQQHRYHPELQVHLATRCVPVRMQGRTDQKLPLGTPTPYPFSNWCITPRQNFRGKKIKCYRMIFSSASSAAGGISSVNMCVPPGGAG